MRKPKPEPVILGWLNIDRAQDTSPEGYVRLVGAVSAAQKLGRRVEVRAVHSDRDGTLQFVEFAAVGPLTEPAHAD